MEQVHHVVEPIPFDTVGSNESAWPLLPFEYARTLPQRPSRSQPSRTGADHDYIVIRHPSIQQPRDIFRKAEAYCGETSHGTVVESSGTEERCR